MKDVVGKGYLLDFYGSLLTERQRYCMKEHYENDLSLGEIAQELEISRQAVHDNLQRARQILEEYEDKLHLVALFQQREQTILQLRQELKDESALTPKIDKLLQSL